MIASACDKIIAQPSTITGSIGVVSLKVSIGRWERGGASYVRTGFPVLFVLHSWRGGGMGDELILMYGRSRCNRRPCHPHEKARF